MEIGAIIALAVTGLTFLIGIFQFVCMWRQTKAQEKIATATGEGVEVQRGIAQSQSIDSKSNFANLYGEGQQKSSSEQKSSSAVARLNSDQSKGKSNITFQ